MITVKEAREIIFSNLYQPSIREVELLEAQGEYLMEDIKADRDFPPFNRVAMDGIAISFEAYERGQRVFSIEGLQAAGMPQSALNDSNNCLEVMTGSMLPKGTDTVIRYEDIEIDEKVSHATVQANIQITQEQNIHKQATDRRAGDLLIESGTLLGAAEIAIAATVGKSTLKVGQKPKVAIVSTGDELVDVDTQPEAHQIRQSNSYALSAALEPLKIISERFHLKDDKKSLITALNGILENFDVLILSGGVSKGKLDYVPEVLDELNVAKCFHKVKQRPGKPFWFGKNNGGKVVFALPGNPVSTFSCFYHYVKPWLFKSMGIEQKTLKARLTKDFVFEAPLTNFLQVKISYSSQGQLEATPVAGKGSGDLANLLNADGFMELDADQSGFFAGEIYPVTIYRI
ncbi:molybdopterin molybdotransferase MoeA [Fulvivirgaceae bacterium BMA10]|uniref:Molybdopterin molybdenumtransferase n=1 Tax=Splendidivirga corallicola TaxID=3051826 RepID=A0ABT8KXR7_9BACT|nr:molybdopterin molybdotransferase MoeA [Fulvivirgaceae bacterium BMA10]